MELGFFLLVQPTGQLNHLLNGRKVIISTATYSPMNSWKLHVKLCSVGGILAFLSCGGQKNVEFTSLASVYIAISMSLLRESL